MGQYKKTQFLERIETSVDGAMGKVPADARKIGVAEMKQFPGSGFVVECIKVAQPVQKLPIIFADIMSQCCIASLVSWLCKILTRVVQYSQWLDETLNYKVTLINQNI